MKVLHITNNYPTEEHPVFGIFVKEQIDSLNKMGVLNDIFFINGREIGKKEYLSSIFKLRKYLKKRKYDIIHCHHSFSGVVLILSGYAFINKCIISYQNDPDYEGGKNLFRSIHSIFNRIIFKNKSRYSKYSKTVWLPNGVDIDIFKPINKVDAKKILNLAPEKRYILFMDSYKLRSQKRVDRFNDVINYIKDNLGYNDIEPIILTNTKRSLIPEYINACDLYLLTSDFEGSPNSIKECLACNTPIVSTNVGMVYELLKECNGCSVANTFDVEELSDLVIKSLQYNEINGRDVIQKNKLDLNSVAEKLRNLYLTILS